MLALIKNFAEDKLTRSLVIAKVDRSAGGGEGDSADGLTKPSQDITTSVSDGLSNPDGSGI